MTVIAWDGEILAADKQCNWANTIRSATKIFRIDDKTVCAVCGSVAAGYELIEWVRGGRKKEDYPQNIQKGDDWARIIIAEGRSVKFTDGRPVFIPIEESIAAWGVGGDFAIGAMEAGKNAIEAVKIANKWCDCCGRGVDWFYTGD